MTARHLHLVHQIERPPKFRTIAGGHDVRERGPIDAAKAGDHQRDGGRRDEVACGKDRDRFRAAQGSHEDRAREGRCCEVERQIPDKRNGRELPDARS